jgi:hypothetical protein
MSGAEAAPMLALVRSGTNRENSMSTTARIVAGSAAGTVLIGGAVAAIVALSGPASASAPSASPTPSGSSSSSTTTTKKHPRLSELRGDLRKNFLHTDTVILNKDGKPETVEAISGSVTAVSATSITVKASDGVSMTFTVDGSTKVDTYSATATPKLAKATIADVGENASVVVGGKADGTSPASIAAGRILIKK